MERPSGQQFAGGRGVAVSPAAAHLGKRWGLEGESQVKSAQEIKDQVLSPPLRCFVG